MPITEVTGPDGRIYQVEHPDNALPSQIIKIAQSQAGPRPGNKLGSSIAMGIDTLQQSYGSSLEGLGNVLDAESLQQIGGDIVRNNQEEIDARLLRESQVPTDEGQISQALDYVAELAGQSAPQMATSMGGATIGGAIGTLGGPLAPFTIPAGAFLGSFISNVPYFYGSNRERQKEAIERGYKTEVDEGSAFLASLPQSSLDAITAAIGAKFIATPAMKLRGGIFTKVAAGSAIGSLTESPTEIGQTVIERAQAGLPLFDDEAIDEYVDAGVGGAVLGGLLGGAGGGISSLSGKDKKESTKKKLDSDKTSEDLQELEIPRNVEVTYKELDGKVRVVPIAVGKDQDAQAVAEESLRGRYDEKYGLTTSEYGEPSAPEPFDIVEGDEVITEEVPVQPEAAVEQVPVEPTVEPELEAVKPTLQSRAEQAGMTVQEFRNAFPDVADQIDKTQPVAEAVQEELFLPSRSDFRISPRMAKSKPRWRGAEVNYGSDLELASYIASGKGKNAGSVRSELIEAGYSPAEIDSMGKDVRSQMKSQFNAGRPISVKVRPDITAEASGVDRRTMSFKDVTKRTPEIQEQAKVLRENIKAGDRQQSRAVAQAADEFKPVQSYDFVPAPESNSEMRNALSKDKVDKLNSPIKDGAPVAVRLDIPAYVSTGTWVPVVHEQTSSFRPGTPMSYQATAVVDGATLGIVSDIAVSGIAAGKAKSTIATIKGNLKKVSPTQAKKMADKALKDPSYVQVGMDPERRGYFYNRETMQEVVAGDQAIQVGPLVLVKNPKYGATPSNEYLSLGQDVVAEASTLKKVSANNQVDVVDSTVTELVDPVNTDPAEGGKVRSIAKRFALKASIIDFKKLFKTTGALKVSEKVYNKTVKKAAERISKVLDKSFIQFPKFEAWYSSRLNMAMNVFQELDPDLSKPEDQFIMKALLAVTSNGNEVSDQTAESFRIYQDWKRTGKLDQTSTKGTREETILEHLKILDNLIAKVGWKDLQLFMGKVGPVSSLRKELESKFGYTKKQAKDMTNGELVTEVVPYSLFLGPKLGSFFNNLNGNFDTTTMDRWFMRTFGRTMGDQLVKVDIQKPKKRLVDAIDTLISDPESNLFRTLKGLKVLPKSGKSINANQIKRISIYFSLKANRQGLSPVENEVRLAINGMAKVSDGFKLMEAPASGTHRRFIRAVMKEGLNDFNKRNNTNFTPAEAQAILWYYEKLIHESNGSRQKGEAPDYAAGANAIYRTLNGRDSGQFVRSDVIRRRGDLPGGTQELQQDVTAQAAQPEVEDRGPQDTFDNGGQLMDFVADSFNAIGDKIKVPIIARMGNTDYEARYNVTQNIIEYNPMRLLKRSKSGVQAAMREEIIHAAMGQVILASARKKFSMAEIGKSWTDFFEGFGQSLTAEERADIQNVYTGLKDNDYVGMGSEYSRAVIQNLLYGEFSEQYVMQSKGGPAWNAVVKLLRSVQAYMAKVLGPMVKTNPEAAQIIVDSVELLKAVDPALRPKKQDVVANAYSAVDENTAKENSQGDDAPPKDASQRVREERKWWDDTFLESSRVLLSKGMTPLITRLRRVNAEFGRLFQNLDNKIRERTVKYQKQAQPFFNKLNSLNSEDFLQLKRLLFFSPTPEEANLPSNKAKMQLRDALLHKHGLLNMYRLDVQPILEEIYAEYIKLGMPIGYLEDYFPRVVKDLEGLIKSYGHKTKRTFETLVREENLRRAENKDADGNADPIPEMESSERARFFQEFLQNKLRLGINGARPPGNVKLREIKLIDKDKLKFYEDPGVAFGSYSVSMVSAMETLKVLGSPNNKGLGGETGELGQLTEMLFQQGKINEQDANELKSIAELVAVQAGQQLEILKFAGQATYAATLIDIGTVLTQFLDLAKVLVLRGPSATAKGIYRTVTGNRVYDIEEDFSIIKEQISAEFDNAGATQRILNIGLKYLVPFKQADVALKHASVEATLIDYLKKANSKPGSKPYKQLMAELTIRQGPDAAFKSIQAFRKKTFNKDSPEAKEAMMFELFDRQPLTYLQLPELHRRTPNARLLYNLKSFMLLDINFNREMALNDLMGPGKTIDQRKNGLKMLVAMMAALTAIGVPKDLLMDFIRGKDTYLSDHVVNNMLQVIGMNRYGVGTIFKEGPVDAVVDRFTPAAYSIIDGTQNDLLAWVKGNREISEFNTWNKAPLFDVWGRFTDKFQEKKQDLYKKKRKQGQAPTIRR